MKRVLKKRIRDTWFGEWMIGGLVLIAFVFLSLVFFFFTYLAGFQDVQEFQTEINPIELEISEPITYEVIDTDVESGLSASGAFAVIHRVTLTNTDEVEADYTVSSKVSEGSDDSELSSKRALGASETYTFTFEHDRAWSEDDVTAEYYVEVGNKTVTKMENETVEYTVDKRIWTWPWWDTSFQYDLS